jgi:carboxypeptidase Q
MRIHTLAAALLLSAAPAGAQEVDRSQTALIVEAGTTDSEAMRIAQYLTDVIGPRLTNSPGMRRAEEWTQAKFREWGLTNVHKEGFEFGRGWELESGSMRMVAPRVIQLTAIPITWTPGTNGTVRAPVVVAPLANDADLERWKGKLQGKIVLLTTPDAYKDFTDPPFRRWSDEELAKFDTYAFDDDGDSGAAAYVQRAAFARRRDAFLKAEGAAATATMSTRAAKILHGSGHHYRVGETPSVPAFEIAQEDYRRLVRLAASGPAPVVEFASSVRFDDSDTQGYNIIADIAGSDPKAGYVMAGAHMDSWAAGDGAVDNAAGVAMVMEAARILRSLGVRPKRTIRFALWSGEEQGLFGSMNYVERHLATRPVPEGATGIARYIGWTSGWPITPKPGHAQLSAYFNLDNGSGRIRGINVQNNPGVVPIFERWLEPFHAMGATQVAMRRVGATDHELIDAVGIPAFQFIQDPLDYGSLRHHTGLDTFDAIKPDDLRQGAIILASFLLNAANADKPLPRVPPPAKPKGAGFYPQAAGS